MNSAVPSHTTLAGISGQRLLTPAGLTSGQLTFRDGRIAAPHEACAAQATWPVGQR